MDTENELVLLWWLQSFLNFYILEVLEIVLGLEISRPRTKPNPRPRPRTWPSLPRPRPRTSASWSRPRPRTSMLSLRTHQGQGQGLTSLKIFHPYAGLQVCTCSSYDLCHPGYIAYRETQSDRLTDKQTDNYWPVILLAQPAELIKQWTCYVDDFICHIHDFDGIYKCF